MKDWYLGGGCLLCVFCCSGWGEMAKVDGIQCQVYFCGGKGLCMVEHHLELYFHPRNARECTPRHHTCQGAEAGTENLTVLYLEAVIWIQHLRSLHTAHLQPGEEASRKRTKAMPTLGLSLAGQPECWAFCDSHLLHSSVILQVSELKKLPWRWKIVNTCQRQTCTLQGALGVSGSDSEKISHELQARQAVLKIGVQSPFYREAHVCPYNTK